MQIDERLLNKIKTSQVIQDILQLTCSNCGCKITGPYYIVDGKDVCRRCSKISLIYSDRRCICGNKARFSIESELICIECLVKRNCNYVNLFLKSVKGNDE